jgi:hypothetical protein
MFLRDQDHFTPVATSGQTGKPPVYVWSRHLPQHTPAMIPDHKAP